MKKKYEIERKFLVVQNLDLLKKALRKKHVKEGKLDIEQGYLSSKPAVRVRTSSRMLNGKWVRHGFLTVKGPGSLKKLEYEYLIPYEDAKQLLKLCKTKIKKTRYGVEVGDHTWDVDQFHGSLQGMWLAEVELGDSKEKFVRPDWAEVEVTEDGRYSNASLAEKGWPSND